MPSRSRQLRIERLVPHLSEQVIFGASGVGEKPIGDQSLPANSKMSQDLLVLQAYSQDLWPRKLLELRENGPPLDPLVDLVLWPETTEQVSAIMRWAHQADCALYPYGAGSGVCGGTLPDDQEQRPRVLVDLKRMRAVRSIDRISMTVWAEAGVIGENLERHLNQEGLTLGHFPSSVYCSSLGGYLATRSAGQFSTKYGKIEDMVLSLELVLSDGTICESGRAPRSAMGPDWTQLLLGTEGTLGFFTAARLQVHSLPECRKMLGFGVRDIGLAIEFSRALVQAGTRPAVLRIYDPLETALTLPSDVLKNGGFDGGAAIIVIYEGRKRLVESEAEEASTIAASLGAQYLGPELGEHWYQHRYDVSYKQQLIVSHGRMVLDTFEIAATWDKLESVYRSVKGVSVGLGVIMAHFSHFYHTGANIYFTLVSHSGLSQSSVEHYDDIWERLLRSAARAGATLSHHHGVGIQKNRWIRAEKGPWIRFFEKVKRGFDPENRLNPGKMGL
jgi:alkyldihydroxyacetonephosphate synthase